MDRSEVLERAKTVVHYCPKVWRKVKVLLAAFPRIGAGALSRAWKTLELKPNCCEI